MHELPYLWRFVYQKNLEQHSLDSTIQTLRRQLPPILGLWAPQVYVFVRVARRRADSWRRRRRPTHRTPRAGCTWLTPAMTSLYVAPPPPPPAADAGPRPMGLQHHRHPLTPSCWLHHPPLTSSHVRQPMIFLCPCVSSLYDCDQNGSRRRDLARARTDRSTGLGRNDRDRRHGGSSLHRSGPSRRSQFWRTQIQRRVVVVSRPGKCCQRQDWRGWGLRCLATPLWWWRGVQGGAEPALRCLYREFQPVASNRCQKWHSGEVTFRRWTTPSSPTTPPVNRRHCSHCTLSETHFTLNIVTFTYLIQIFGPQASEVWRDIPSLRTQERICPVSGFLELVLFPSMHRYSRHDCNKKLHLLSQSYLSKQVDSENEGKISQPSSRGKWLFEWTQ